MKSCLKQPKPQDRQGQKLTALTSINTLINRELMSKYGRPRIPPKYMSDRECSGKLRERGKLSY